MLDCTELKYFYCPESITLFIIFTKQRWLLNIQKSPSQKALLILTDMAFPKSVELSDSNGGESFKSTKILWS